MRIKGCPHEFTLKKSVVLEIKVSTMSIIRIRIIKMNIRKNFQVP